MAANRAFVFDPVQEAILAVALVRDGRSSQRWATVRAEHGITNLTQRRTRRLLPLAYDALRDEQRSHRSAEPDADEDLCAAYDRACLEHRDDEEILAATVYLHAGDTLFYKFNASDPAVLGARPNDLLLWAGIELAIQLGCRRLDLGASDDDQPGLIRFKRGFASVEREIQVLASGPPLSPAHAPFREVLSKLTAAFTDPGVPDAVTEQAGAILYRYFA